jgi:hypothetical protein
MFECRTSSNLAVVRKSVVSRCKREPEQKIYVYQNQEQLQAQVEVLKKLNLKYQIL